MSGYRCWVYTRGTHYVFKPRRTNDVTTLLIHYIIDQFRNTCDKKITLFRTTIFIPRDKMSGKGDVSSTSSVDLSRRDFRAMVHYDYCQEKIFSECFQSLNTVFGDQSSSKALYSGGSDSSCLVRERWKTMTVAVEWQRPLP